jgi:hypothetical protein
MSKRLARAATHQALDQLPAMMNMEIDNQFQQNVIDSEEKDTKYSALNRRMDYIAALDGCIEITYVSSLVVTGHPSRSRSESIANTLPEYFKSRILCYRFTSPFDVPAIDSCPFHRIAKGITFSLYR